jgi:uncharacterized surface protein with fasciclin (FAS1) repeats
MIRHLRIASVAAGLLTFTACADSYATAPESALSAAASRAPAPAAQSIGQIALAAAQNPIEAEREFTQLVAALQFVDATQQTALVDLFVNGRDQYTVFAPTDAAFTGLYALASTLLNTNITAVEQLPSSIVRDVLLYHVTEGRRAANSVLPRNGVRVIATLKGETFSVTTSGSIRDGLTPVDPDPRPDAVIRRADLSASNGIVHVIDQVILPPSVVETLLSLAAGN